MKIHKIVANNEKRVLIQVPDAWNANGGFIYTWKETTNVKWLYLLKTTKCSEELKYCELNGFFLGIQY